jgi:hypothetical protein
VVALALALSLLMGSAPLAAQGAASPPPSCEGPEFHQFDFWLGDWEVTSGQQVVGTNDITSILKGCVIHEHWAGAKGLRGESFNFFDRQTGKWNQVWVDDTGSVLRLTGSSAEGKMTLEGENAAGGKPVRHRIVWRSNQDGTVRQVWTTSTDGGKTWSVAFDGLYRKKR